MLLPALAALSLIATSVVRAHEHDARDFVPGNVLPRDWVHDQAAEVNKLFKRQGMPNPAPAIGSAAWSANYPMDGPVPPLAPTTIPQMWTDIPQEWLNAYNAAKSAGLIPSIPVSNETNGDEPTYPAGFVPTGSQVCSGTYKCRAPGDIWDAPANHIGISFDDGPQFASPTLYTFLESIKQPSTHFMIGARIWDHPDVFQLAVNNPRAQICVHTYTHRYMTTLDDMELLREFGWTMQIIHDSIGGRVPAFWRPPYGDADNRVRAIATHVFNLTTVFWNQDTEDWTLGEVPPTTTVPTIEGQLQGWLSGPQTTGLIILEHELTDASVGIWINTTWPLLNQYHWTPQAIPDLFGLPWYHNAQNSTSPVTPQDTFVILPTATSTVSVTTTVGAGGSQSTPPSGGSSGSGSGSGSTNTSGASALFAHMFRVVIPAALVAAICL